MLSPSQNQAQAQVMNVPLDQIVFSKLNPRSDAGTDLAELIRSLGTDDAPRLAQLPTGELLPDGKVRLLSGERRARAVIESGRWSAVNIVLYSSGQLSPSEAHLLRVAENLHRRDLNQFDEAAALKVSYVLANAQALGAGEDANRILNQAEESGIRLPMVLRELEQLLEALPQWSATRPAVNWDAVLDELGIELEPSRRRQKLRVLDVTPELHPALAALAEPLSEVALRELGRLGEADQAQLVAAIVQNPDLLSDKVVAIVKAVREQGWSVEQALTHFLFPVDVSSNTVSHAPTPSNTNGNGNGSHNAGRGGGGGGVSAGPHKNGGKGGSSRGRGQRGEGSDEGFDGYGFGGEGGGAGGGDGGSSGTGDLDSLEGFEMSGLAGELAPGVADELELLGVSEAAQSSIATLDPHDQQKVLQVLLQQPEMAGKIRRIVKLMREEGWSLEAAIDEVTGNGTGKNAGEDNTTHKVDPNADNLANNYCVSANDTGTGEDTQAEKLDQAVLCLLAAQSSVRDGVELLYKLASSGNLANLPEPWNSTATKTFKDIVQALRETGLVE